MSPSVPHPADLTLALSEVIVSEGKSLVSAMTLSIVVFV